VWGCGSSAIGRPQLMGSGQTLVVERHGEPIGFFVPVAKDRQAGLEALGRLGVVVESILAATGLDEDELVAEIAGNRRCG